MFEYLPYFALLGRVLLLGYEKISLKQLSQNDCAEEATLLYFIVALIFLTPLLYFCEMPQDFSFIGNIVIFSIIYTIAFILFVHAISIGEASLVSPLYDVNVFFVAVLGAIFLSEPLTVFKIAGTLLLIYGASFLSKQENPWKSFLTLFHNKACMYMILCSMLVAVGRIMDGKMMKEYKISSFIYSFSLYLGISILLVLRGFLFPPKQKLFSHTVRILCQRPKYAIITGCINAYAYCFFLYAITKVDVSIAQPISMLSMIVTMMCAKLIFHEVIGKRVIGAILMLLGALFISQSL